MLGRIAKSVAAHQFQLDERRQRQAATARLSRFASAFSSRRYPVIQDHQQHPLPRPRRPSLCDDTAQEGFLRLSVPHTAVNGCCDGRSPAIRFCVANRGVGYPSHRCGEAGTPRPRHGYPRQLPPRAKDAGPPSPSPQHITATIRTMPSAHRHLDLPLQAPAAEEEAGPDRGSGDRAEGRGEARDHTGASQR